MGPSRVLLSKLGVCFALVLTACGSSAPARPATLVFAARPTPDLGAQAAAAVRLRVEDGRTSLLRSGVIVDPRGYVLTSFSSVGVSAFPTSSRSAAARPGTLFSADQVRVEVFDGPYASVPTEYIARVVRGDLRLNLALLRITATLEGLLPEEQRFPSVRFDATPAEPLWGGSGFAIGAAAHVPSLAVYTGSVIAGISNSRGEIAGYLVDVRRSTLDGAPFFDSTGEFSGVLSSGFLRPRHRVPAAWTAALAGGHIDDREIVGVEPLAPGVWTEIDLIGDSVYVPGLEEAHVEAMEEFIFALPNLVAGTVVVEPSVPVAAYRGGALMVGGSGEIFVPAESDVLVAVHMPRPDDPRGLRLRARFEPLQ